MSLRIWELATNWGKRFNQHLTNYIYGIIFWRLCPNSVIPVPSYSILSGIIGHSVRQHLNTFLKSFGYYLALGIGNDEADGSIPSGGIISGYII